MDQVEDIVNSGEEKQRCTEPVYTWYLSVAEHTTSLSHIPLHFAALSLAAGSKGDTTHTSFSIMTTTVKRKLPD